MPLSKIASQLEAVLFNSATPVTERELKDLLNITTQLLNNAVKELTLNLENDNHSIILKRIGGGIILETRAEYSEILSRFRDNEKKRKINLSRAAIETAAIIAYNQPVTRSEIDEIRGVRSDGIVSRLLENGLIKISGRKKNTSGAPLLFSTTQKFLEIFGLNAIADLPALDELNNINPNLEIDNRE